MRDRRLWTEPNSLLRRVSPGRAAQDAGEGGTERKRQVWEESQPQDGRLALHAPSLSSTASSPGCPRLQQPPPPPPHRARGNGGSSSGPLFPRPPQGWPLIPGLRGASQAALRGGGTRARRSQAQARGGGGRLPPPSLAGTDPGRVSLRAEGTGGRGRPRGGAGGALRLSGALRRDLGPGPGLLAQSLPSSGPPFCPGHSPQVVQTELPGAGNRRTGRNRGVSLARRSLGAQGPAPGRLGRRGPSGPSSLLPSSPGRWCRLSQGLPCARCPSPASGCCLLSGPRSPPRLF